ncbi:DUF2306 domain-containing protein [Aquimarina algiphila]|uniref:DUF2306 domain-containing protein n=1 Tax=Aquimarina algiphila TaxID=2047982 RepID=UPI00232C38E9|nr:DUF2306 domain-containing protein [Aquimarina algiphila]
METIINNTLYLHIVVGTISLLIGLVAILSSKGKKWHRQSGKIYVYAMTGVFITGLIVAGFRLNRFLFLIAFLSYYTVFCGVRSLKLKKLHKKQNPKWYDWFAGIINALVNTVFVAFGLYLGLTKGFTTGGALLSIGFGLGGLVLSYTNLKPFIVRPDKAYHWYLSHIGNMMGGYIATFTAFLSTIVSRYDFINPYLAFALPAIIGVPLLFFWLHKTEKRFNPKL